MGGLVNHLWQSTGFALAAWLRAMQLGAAPDFRD